MGQHNYGYGYMVVLRYTVMWIYKYWNCDDLDIKHVLPFYNDPRSPGSSVG